MFTKRAYHHGIVLIRCEGCEGVHLIADNLGWFEDTSVNVEIIIERMGEKYKKLSAEGLFQMSTQDVLKENSVSTQQGAVEETKH
jgi:mitochondrial protein import protein ZIM17